MISQVSASCKIAKKLNTERAHSEFLAAKFTVRQTDGQTDDIYTHKLASLNRATLYSGHSNISIIDV